MFINIIYYHCYNETIYYTKDLWKILSNLISEDVCKINYMN